MMVRVAGVVLAAGLSVWWSAGQAAPDQARWLAPLGGVQVATNEGPEDGHVDPRNEPLHVLRSLHLIKGHLLVGMELYKSGAIADGAKHLRHPREESYVGIEEYLADRNVGFKDDLRELVALALRNAPAAEVEAVYNRTLLDIDRAAAAYAEWDKSGQRVEIVRLLLREAAEEYGRSLSDERIANAAEYQDGLGFVRVANDVLRSAMPDLSRVDAAKAKELQADVAAMAKFWPTLAAPQRPPVSTSEIAGAVARAEFAMSRFVTVEG